jgi:hypothetical protein
MVCRPAHSRTSGRALDDIPSHGSGRRDYADKIVCVERGTLYSRVQARLRKRYGEADGDGSPTGARQGDHAPQLQGQHPQHQLSTR